MGNRVHVKVHDSYLRLHTSASRITATRGLVPVFDPISLTLSVNKRSPSQFPSDPVFLEWGWGIGRGVGPASQRVRARYETPTHLESQASCQALRRDWLRKSGRGDGPGAQERHRCHCARYAREPPPAQVATGAGALLSRELTGWLTLLSACVRAYVCTLTWDAAGGSGLCLSGLEGPHCQTA